MPHVASTCNGWKKFQLVVPFQIFLSRHFGGASTAITNRQHKLSPQWTAMDFVLPNPASSIFEQGKFPVNHLNLRQITFVSLREFLPRSAVKYQG